MFSIKNLLYLPFISSTSNAVFILCVGLSLKSYFRASLAISAFLFNLHPIYGGMGIFLCCLLLFNSMYAPSKTHMFDTIKTISKKFSIFILPAAPSVIFLLLNKNTSHFDPQIETFFINYARVRSGNPFPASDGLAYVLLWRNAYEKPDHFFAPYPGNSLNSNFMELLKKNFLIFINQG